MPLPLPPSNAELVRHAGGLIERGQLKQAERVLRDVLKSAPRMLDALLALGVLHGMRGEAAEAARVLQRAVDNHPGSDAANYNLGQALIELGRFADAAPVLERAVALTSRAAAHEKLGDCLRQLGRLDEAVLQYEKAVALDPGNGLALSSAIEMKRKLCDWTGLDVLESRLLAAARAGKPVEPLLMLHVVDDPALARSSAEVYWRRLVPTLPPVKTKPPRAKEKLRIGYLSGDFRQHPMVSVVAEMIELHNRASFEVIGLSYGVDDKSAQRRRMEKAFDRFIDLEGDGQQRMAQRIADLGLDILVDLAGLTANARLAIINARPAPLLCHYMGFPGTLGGAYDYVIADAVVAPRDGDANFSEALVRLPHSYWAVDTRRDAPPATTRAAQGLPEDALVLASFNGQQKLSPSLLDVWARVLAAVPDAVLWLYADHATAAENLLRQTAARGIAPARVIMAGRVPAPEHLARIGLADLMLDALPYGGHTTVCDALWRGVPVIAVEGRTFAARVGKSLLDAAGLGDCVAPTLADCEARVIALASDRASLSALKTRVAAEVKSEPLFDTRNFTLHLEAAYRTMWDRAVAGQRPSSFSVLRLRIDGIAADADKRD